MYGAGQLFRSEGAPDQGLQGKNNEDAYSVSAYQLSEKDLTPVVFALIAALVIFNIYSDLPEKYPLFGAINFSMVPVLFIVGGIIFILAILKS